MFELNCFKNTGRASGNDSVGRNIFGNHGSCTYQSIFSNSNSSQYGCIASNRSPFFYMCLYHFPVSFGLLTSVRIGGPWKKIVRKHNAVTYKYIVLDMHSFT